MKNELVDRGWQQMNALLDEHMPSERKTPIWWWTALPVVLISSLIIWFWMNDVDSASDAIESQSGSPVAVMNEESFDTQVNHPYITIPDQIDNKVEKSDVQVNSDWRTSSTDRSSIKTHIETDAHSMNHAGIAVKDRKIDHAEPSSQHQHPSSMILDENIDQIGKSPVDSAFDQMVINENASILDPLQSLAHIDHRPIAFISSNAKLSIESLAFHGQNHDADEKNDSRVGYWLGMGVGSYDHALNYGLSMGIRWPISQRLGMSLGASLRQLNLSPSDSPKATAYDFQNVTYFTQFLAVNNVAPRTFHKRSWEVTVPIALDYQIINHLGFYSKIELGALTGHHLTYNPIMETEVRRSPVFTDDQLGVSDLIYTKDVFVAKFELGMRYQIAKQIALLASYSAYLSDINRGTQYTNANQLEHLTNQQIDRDFYQLRSNEDRPRGAHLGLEIRF